MAARKFTEKLTEIRTKMSRSDAGGKFGLALDASSASSGDLLGMTMQSVCSGSIWRNDLNLHIGHAYAEILKDSAPADQVSAEEVELAGAEELGRGAGGYVLRASISASARCTRLAGSRVALKVVNIDGKTKRDSVVTEVYTLLRISQESASLIDCYGAFLQDNTVRVVLEYMDWSLYQVKRDVGRTPPDLLPLILVQVLDGLTILHANGILHRDVKCGNILVNRRGEVKVSDFGISKVNLDGDVDGAMIATSFVGTMSHMSPERLMGEDYSYASDIWSVGIVTFELATGEYPYGEIQSILQLTNKVTNDPVPDLPSDVHTAPLVDFIGCCMQKRPGDRRTADQLLEHDLIVEHKSIHTPEESCRHLAEWLESNLPRK